MEKTIENMAKYAPIFLLVCIVLGFFITEWVGAFPEFQLRSLMMFGEDKRVKLLG